MTGREIFLEYVALGDTARATAIDAETGLEATAIGPASAPRSDLEKIALGKLRRRLGEQDTTAPPPDGVRRV